MGVKVSISRCSTTCIQTFWNLASNDLVPVPKHEIEGIEIIPLWKKAFNDALLMTNLTMINEFSYYKYINMK